MKNILIYILVMIAVLIFLPLAIVNMGPAGAGPGISPNVEKTTIKVFIKDQNKIVEMDVEEYIAGVVAAEIPALFEPETLKAQAAAARTFAFGRLSGTYTDKNDTHPGADICTDSTHCQSWISKEAVTAQWKAEASAAGTTVDPEKYWAKITSAVNTTAGQVIYYDNKLINALYHSNSSGKTANSEDVWEGDSVPYLRSVTSNGENLNPDYYRTVSFTAVEFSARMKTVFPAVNLHTDSIKTLLADIVIKETSAGDRIKKLAVGGVTMSGEDFRGALGLRSAAFTVSEDAATGKISIRTVGSGHGVGMSQWGANYMAKNGGSWDEILKYYYRGVTIAKYKK